MSGQVVPTPCAAGPVAPGPKYKVRFQPVGASDPTWCSICHRSNVTLGARAHRVGAPATYVSICMACVACLGEATHLSNQAADGDGPVVADFWNGLRVEREFQAEHWGRVEDRNKAPADWFWLVGYLAGKALASHLRGDHFKARHHTISAAAALSHWFDAVPARVDDDRPSDLEQAIGPEKIADVAARRAQIAGGR